LIATLTEPY